VITVLGAALEKEVEDLVETPDRSSMTFLDTFILKNEVDVAEKFKIS